MKVQIAFVLVLLSACTLERPLPEIGARSPRDIGDWEGNNIVDDAAVHSLGYVQTPEETIQIGRGTCMDFAVLMMAMIHDELGGCPELVAGTVGGKGLHAWVRYAGIDYESEDGCIASADYVEQCTLSYGWVMAEVSTLHRLDRIGAT